MKRKSESGVALVITLILLSVITFMAISFLVISRREAASASVLTLSNTAKNAADTALEIAVAQATAQMVANTNGYSFGMIVSTNLDLPFLPNGSPINIATNSYFDQNGNLLTGTPFLQNLTHLQVLPRVPVFIKTTVNGVPTNEFRYFLDLNRNGKFDPSGNVRVLDDAGGRIPDPNNGGLPLTNYVVGDPQWIGVLEHPDQPHSSSNKFIARYCFIALPIGNSLDMNYAGNQAKFSKAPNQNFDGGFLRNENVGTWELNLPGFLASVNPNYWNTNNPANGTYNYLYNSLNSGSTGLAFDDAAAMLQVRFNNNYNNLNTFAQMYPNPASWYAVGSNNIDWYAYGPLMNGFFQSTPNVNPASNPNLRWSGSDNPNTFFTPQDLFNLVPGDPLNPNSSFSNRMYQAGIKLGTYNRYTYYRFLQQMSFGSAPEAARNVAFTQTANNGVAVAVPVSTTPLNLNYINVNGHSETEFIPWTNATMFFTNCADRLIRQAFPNPVVYYANGVLNEVSLCATNIPLYPVNFYTPAVHRLLQLAANIYDARLVRPANGPDFPTIFRPVFSRSGGQNGTNFFISGYVEELPPVPGQAKANSQYSIPLSLPENLYGNPNPGYRGAVYAVPNFPATTDPYARTSYKDIVNIYSAPWIIGAKKGFPNFNQLAMESVVQITRKLQVDKVALNTPRSGWYTNQLYSIGISNLFGIESWNSYSADYPRGVQLSVLNYLSLTLSNDQGIRISSNLVFSQSYPPASPAGFAPWPGFKAPLTPNSNPRANTASFIFPLVTNTVFLPDSIWRQLTRSMVLATTNALGTWERTGIYSLPRFGLSVTNRTQYCLTDGPTGRIIDYVQFDGVNRFDDLLAESAGSSLKAGIFTNSTAVDSVWNTNRPGGTTSIAVPTTGIIQQIAISKGDVTLGQSDWGNSQLPNAIQNNVGNATAGFATFVNSQATNANDLVRQAPYTPTRKLVMSFLLQANDPLVHYTAADLGATNYLTYLKANEISRISLTNIQFGGLSTRYAPWLNFRGPGNPNDYDLRVKDPLIRCSDDWQFPENAFPNVGWLGRVHRGTPWQTVYLKSGIIDLTNWVSFSGHTNPLTAVLTHPMNDWKILDLFTTAPNDNATRGQLSINNTNEAAWHAVLDGVVVITNSAKANYSALVMDPNFHAQQLGTIISGINAARLSFPGYMQPDGRVINYTNGSFTSLGQLLSVPQLTLASPFLNTSNALNGGPALFNPSAISNNPVLLSDAAYERIPQQILSLVRVGSPRYVIFAYGQALKPADHSVYQGSGFFGLVTNYAIASESVTRTVVDFANQVAPPGQSVNVLPPTAVAATNYLGFAFLPPPPPPQAQVKAHTPIGPQ
jgi:hypothetical protein